MPFDVEMCEKCGRCVALADCEYHKPVRADPGVQHYVGLQMAAMNQARNQALKSLGFRIRWTTIRDHIHFGTSYTKGQSGWWGESNPQTPGGEIFGTREAAEKQKAKAESVYSFETAYEIFPA